jgi:hypothetical protein
LNLKGCTAAWARTMAARTANHRACADWEQAATWLAKVEDYAHRAQEKAGAALRAAENGLWREAMANAICACAMEFATARGIWRNGPLAWQTFCQLVRKACVAQEKRSHQPSIASA